MTRRTFVSGLLLAAGSSSRFGDMKLLARLRGETLFRRTVRTLADSDVDERVVVLGRAARALRESLDDDRVRVVVNPAFRMGLSSSLRLGIQSLDDRSNAVVVCLADQPFVTTELVDQIVTRFRETGADAVAASSGGLVSPPVLLGRKLYGEVDRLRGDKGAKAVLERLPTFERVEASPMMLLDIDTREELTKAQELLKGSREGRVRARDGLSRGRPSVRK